MEDCDGRDGTGGDATAGEQQETDENVEVEVIELDSSSSDESGPEVEVVHEKNLFDFCMDQLENGSTDSRQEARDLLLDSFGEICSSEFDLLDVMAKKGYNSKQEKSLAKFREQLEKKNPKKMKQKITRKIRDYHKERWERMTELEKEAYRQRKSVSFRQYYRKLSVEVKRERKQKEYKRIKKSETLMERKRATDQKYWARKKVTNAGKFKCKFTACGQAFMRDYDLAKHERIHLGAKPFTCTWPDCHHSANLRSSLVRHVRTQHFKLPKTLQEQARLNIVDHRNPGDFIQVDADLETRRLE